MRSLSKNQWPPPFEPDAPSMNYAKLALLAAAYTSATWESVQEYVLASFNDPTGSVEILAGTSCLGFGVNLRDVREVVLA